MPLLNNNINNIEAEIQDVASQVSAIQSTFAGTNTAVQVIEDDRNNTNTRGFRLLDSLGTL